MKKNKQSILVYWLLVFLCLFSVWFKLSWFGIIFLSLVFLWQASFFGAWILKVKKIELGFLSYFFLSSFYVIGLSAIYYLFGLSKISVSIFIILAGLLPIFLKSKTSFASLLKISDWPKSFKKSSHFLPAVILIFFLVWLALNPIMDGSPTPWENVPWPAFVLFGLVSLLLLLDIFYVKRQNGLFTSFIYLFFIVAIVPLRYVLSFGYDTLIHQGALAEIAANGRIFPLTPFYVGQYSLEILFNFVSGLSFVFIERWLVPVFFVIFIGFISRYLLANYSRKINFFVAPLVALLFLPAVFYYSVPFSLSLIFSLASVAFIYIYLRRKKLEFYWAAMAMAVAAVFIHPFVGINVLVAAFLAKKFSSAKERQKKLWFFILFAAVSLAVALAFVLYNWLSGKVVYLSDPAFYLNNFLSIFGNPLWYVYAGSPWWLQLIYLYEKINIFLIFILGAWMVFRKNKDNQANAYIFVLAIGAFVSAWLFVSGIQVDDYSIGDQVNYSFRLLSCAKWFLFFPVLLLFADTFSWLAAKGKSVRIAVMVALAILSAISLYLTYPRYDEISRLGVNNIRPIDYEILKAVRAREGGKDGYLIFSNQLFCGAAIQKYGFGPYYKSPWGDLLFCSTPMAGEMYQRFYRIMYGDAFDPELLYEVMRETGINRAYLITTDYWPLKSVIEAKASSYAKEIIRVGNNNIYLFSLK